MHVISSKYSIVECSRFSTAKCSREERVVEKYNLLSFHKESHACFSCLDW